MVYRSVEFAEGVLSPLQSAHEMRRLRNAADAGGGCFHPKAHQEWQRAAYLREGFVSRSLIDVLDAVAKAEPFLEAFHSTLPKGEARTLVWKALRQLREAASAAGGSNERPNDGKAARPEGSAERSGANP